MLKKISIIIPVYKAESYIRRCLDSILKQSFADWECVLVDDGSPDSSGLICDEYAEMDTRFRVIHKSNDGVSSARNAGIGCAYGEWITFVDADDWVETDWLESVIDRMKTSRGDLYMWGHVRETPSGIIEYKYIPDSTEFSDSLSFIISDTCKHSMWSYIFRREWVDKFNCTCPVGIHRSEDQCFIFQYLSHSPRICVLGIAPYHYVDIPASVVNSSHRVTDFADNLRVAERYEKYTRDFGDINQQFKHAVIFHFFSLYIYYIRGNGLMKDQMTQPSYNKYFDAIDKIYPQIKWPVTLRLGRLSMVLAIRMLQVKDLMFGDGKE